MSASTLGWNLTATGSIGATLTLVTPGPTRFGGYFFGNTANAAVSYVQIFDAPTTSAVTLGTTAPKLSFAIPANGSANLHLGTDGIRFLTGVVIAVTTTRAGSTGPASTVDYNVWYA